MSRTPSINAFKHKYDYVSDGERCENCRHFKDGYTKLINSIPRAERPYCKLGEFYTNKHGMCNEWGGELRKAREMNHKPIAVFVPAPLRHDEWKRRFTLNWIDSEPTVITHLYSEELVRQQQAEIEAFKEVLIKVKELLE